MLLMLMLFGLLGFVVAAALLLQKFAPKHAAPLKYELDSRKSAHEIRDELLAHAHSLKEYQISFAGDEVVQFKRSFQPGGTILLAALFSWIALLFHLQHQGQMCAVNFVQNEDSCTIKVQGTATKELRTLLDQVLSS